MVEPDNMNFKTCYLCHSRFVPTVRHYNGELHPEFCERCNLKAAVITVALIAGLAALCAYFVFYLSR